MPLLAATGQSGRLHRSSLLFFCGLGMSALSHLAMFEPMPVVRLGLATGGFFVALAAALNPLLRIRCPSCSLRWMWWALRSKHYSRWFFWLQEFNECPRCGYSVRSA
jgi:hypothetical protein